MCTLRDHRKNVLKYDVFLLLNEDHAVLHVVLKGVPQYPLLRGFLDIKRIKNFT